VLGARGGFQPRNVPLWSQRQRLKGNTPGARSQSGWVGCKRAVLEQNRMVNALMSGTEPVMCRWFTHPLIATVRGKIVRHLCSRALVSGRRGRAVESDTSNYAPALNIRRITGPGHAGTVLSV